jgi:hypothetical protein
MFPILIDVAKLIVVNEPATETLELVAKPFNERNAYSDKDAGTVPEFLINA